MTPTIYTTPNPKVSQSHKGMTTQYETQSNDQTEQRRGNRKMSNDLRNKIQASVSKKALAAVQKSNTGFSVATSIKAELQRPISDPNNETFQLSQGDSLRFQEWLEMVGMGINGSTSKNGKTSKPLTLQHNISRIFCVGIAATLKLDISTVTEMIDEMFNDFDIVVVPEKAEINLSEYDRAMTSKWFTATAQDRKQSIGLFEMVKPAKVVDVANPDGAEK